MQVLIVEDEPRVSTNIEAALGAAGYTCDLSSDGEDAWFRGDTEAFDSPSSISACRSSTG